MLYNFESCSCTQDDSRETRPLHASRYTLYATKVFSEADVKELLHDKRLEPPVASLYLNTDRARAEGEKYLATFRMVIHQADKQLRHQKTPEAALARDRLQEVLPEVLHVLDTEVAPQPVVRGIAMFVSLAVAPDSDPRSPAFTLFTLPRPVRTQGRVERRPYIRPLLFLLDQYERVGVLVADRNHARIFTLFLGEIETVRHRTADTPRRHHQGGWKQMLLQRDVDGHVKAHIRATVREAVNLFGERPLKRIVLGGSEETLALLRRELPAHFREQIVGVFLAEPHARDPEIVTRALAFAHEAEHREEARRVQGLIDALARRPGHLTGSSHHEATAGIPDTLRALSEQRVQRLLLQAGLHRPGSVCDNCATLTIEKGGPCSNCRLTLREVPDVLELAVEHAQEQGAEVEFISHSPFLEGLGGVAALLRF